MVAVIAAFAKKSESDATAADIAAGHASGLEDWTAGSLGELSRNVVGTWHYVRAIGGARVSGMTASLHSRRTRGELLRLSAKKEANAGEITALTNWTRLDISFTPASCQIWVNRVELGTLGLASGRISDPRGTDLGVYQRGQSESRLFFRGRDLAMIRPAASPESQLPAVPEPFCTWIAPSVDEEATLWLISILALEAGNFALPVGGMV